MEILLLLKVEKKLDYWELIVMKLEKNVIVQQKNILKKIFIAVITMPKALKFKVPL